VRSAIILVGGEARRAGGQEKYFFRFNGRTFLEHILESLRGVVDDVVLAARDPAQCERFAHIPGLRCVPDHRQGIGPLGGLHAGVHAVRGDPVFVSACDMPCINGRVVALLFSVIESGPWDAVIPAWDPEMIEPLHAVYRRQPLLDYLESHEHLSMRAMVRSMNARYLSIDEIRALDPDLRTFTNINRPEDLERISREWGGPGREPPAGSL
jgi:molybdopterin-guanine dinucleotide biosynthesis protein A